MVARRFIEEDSIHGSRILIVHPPRLFDIWNYTLDMFGIGRYADFISCGNLEKIFEDSGDYLPWEEYDLIIVDEAHRFRGDTSNMYDNLQRICKTERVRYGRVGGRNKMVMLVSATPLNISPKDLYNLLLLFQGKHKSNIDGIPNLQNYFAPRIARYKKLMGADTVDMTGVNNLYEEILGTFELFNPKIDDDMDIRLKYLDEVRTFRKKNPGEFERIKNLPVKSRTGRDIKASGKDVKPDTALVYIIAIQTGIL